MRAPARIRGRQAAPAQSRAGARPASVVSAPLGTQAARYGELLGPRDGDLNEVI